MKKILYLILISLLIITAYFKFQEKAQGDFNVYAINSYYSYIYDPARKYSVNYYLPEEYLELKFEYSLIQEDKEYILSDVEESYIGKEKIVETTYYNRIIDFYIPEPLYYQKATYLLLRNDKYAYKLKIGIFNTYYAREYNYLNYDSLEGEYNLNLESIKLKTNEEINNCYIADFIDVEVIKNYNDYDLILNYKEDYYLYKFYLSFSINTKDYLIDVIRLKTTNLSLNDYLKYLNIGIEL